MIPSALQADFLYSYGKLKNFNADKLWFILLTEPLKYLSPLKGEMSAERRQRGSGGYIRLY